MQCPPGAERAVRRVLVMANAYPDDLRPYHGAYVHTHVEALREAGLEVDVLAVRGYLGKQEYVKGALRALALNARARYDVLHAYYGLMGLVGRLQIRAPLVISFTSGDIQPNPDASGAIPRGAVVQAKANLAGARLAAATITPSKAMEQLLPASCRQRNRVIHWGIDLSRFGRLSRLRARAQLGWDSAQPTVIFVANPDRPVKNFPLAQATVERLKERVPEAVLRVAATVSPADVPVWMAAADALLLTSYVEGSPNVISEAMAAELPAVSTPVGDVPERFGDVPGIYVRPPEPDALADALELAFAHGRAPEAREAVAVLDRRRTSQQVMDVYESVAGRRSTGSRRA
jgi:glycosyltransferase involved in cell wall biosynthesis